MNAPQTIDQIDINALAKRILEEHHNDVQASLVAFMAEGEADELVYRSVMRPLYRTACYEVLARQVRATRSKVWAVPHALTSKLAERAKSVGENLLLNFPLPGGLPLRLATKPEIEKASAFYRAQSSDMAAKTRWLDRVAKSLGPNKKVSDVFSEAKLRELQEETSK